MFELKSRIAGFNVLLIVLYANFIIDRGEAFLQAPTTTFPTQHAATAAAATAATRWRIVRLQSSSSTTLEQETKISDVLLQGEGMPSTVGWTSGRLSRLTKWADAYTPNRPIICEYQPDGLWLWRKWQGTVLKANWRSVVASMTLSLAIHCFVRHGRGIKWPWYAVPPQSDALIVGLSGIKKAWEYHLTICTFVLTFFTSQSFAYWQSVYTTTRKIQGRINDYCMLLVMGTQRASDVKKTKTKVNGVGNGVVNGVVNGSHHHDVKHHHHHHHIHNVKESRGYSDKGRDLVHTCTRLIRMSHIFFWAQTSTASNGLMDSERFIADTANCPLPLDSNHIGPVLLSPYGLKALVETGQLTKEEAQDLNNSMLPPSQYAYILLVWVGLHTMKAFKDKILVGKEGLEQNLLNQLSLLRGCMFDIDDLRAGRMPLAYVQLVQVLVDSLVALSPFALYPELGIVSVPLVGLLTLFFRGLMALSKSFLDPFGVEGFEEQNIRVDVLVSEVNFGASKRWSQAGATLPNT